MGMNNTSNSDTYTKPAVESIAELAKSAAGATVLQIPTQGLGEGLPASVPVLFDHRPNGRGLIPLAEELERYRIKPEAREGTATASTLKAFIDLVNRHKDEDSAIFARADWPEPKLTAVIDYHTKDRQARNCNHLVEYPFPVTEEFKAWIDNDQKAMSQADFAAFIEEHAAELSSPFDAERIDYERLFHVKAATPAEMITLSRGLKVFVAATVSNSVTLQSGEGEIVWNEEHRDAGGNKIVVPGLFLIDVPAFIGGDTIRLPARLRYRASAGKVTWQYALYRWKYWLRDRIQQDLAEVVKETSLPGYEGEPEA